MAHQKYKLDEEHDQKIIDGWFSAADEIQNADELKKFITSLMVDNYEHDYGTVVHAIAAIAGAAIKVADRTEQGGITGFQASCLFWTLANRQFGITGPARLIRFEDMLYPQNISRFEKMIDRETWNWVQGKAKESLASGRALAEVVREHRESIAAGNLPFGYTLSDEA